MDHMKDLDQINKLFICSTDKKDMENLHSDNETKLISTNYNDKNYIGKIDEHFILMQNIIDTEKGKNETNTTDDKQTYILTMEKDKINEFIANNTSERNKRKINEHFLSWLIKYIFKCLIFLGLWVGIKIFIVKFYEAKRSLNQPISNLRKF